MITRREAILGLGAAAFGAAEPSALGVLKLLRPSHREIHEAACSEDAGNDSIDARLGQALALLETRANSEEGVPVFLACINQVQDAHAPQAGPPALSTAVAAEMRENAAAWKRIRPNPPASDVAKLIEVVAERDFLVGGTGHKA